MEDREESVQHFLDLIKRSRRGKFKIYIGMIAGVCFMFCLSEHNFQYAILIRSTLNVCC